MTSDEGRRKPDEDGKRAESDLICIHCGAPTASLYERYSSSVLRLTDCKACGSVVDPFVERDWALLCIDVLVQDKTAYRHVLHNRTAHSRLMPVLVLLLICSAYESSFQLSPTTYQAETVFYLALFQSALGLLVFFLVWLGFTLPRSRHELYANGRILWRAVILSYYGKLCVVLAIVFRLHDEMSYRHLTSLILFIGRLQMHRALRPTDSVSGLSVLATSAATAAEYGVYQWVGSFVVTRC